MKYQGDVLPHLVARGALDCGNIISNTRYPNQDKFKSATLKLSVGNGVLVSNITNFSDMQHYDKGMGLSIILARLFKAKLGVQSRNDLSLSTKKVLTYELDNSDSAFTTLCAEPLFQQWFEQKVKKKDLYFVVGLQTIADAVFGLDAEGVKSVAAGLSVPTQQPGMDVEAKAGAFSERARDTQFVAENEQIYAVQYRKVDFQIMGVKDIQNASLNTKQYWKTYLKTRSGDDKDEYTVVSLREGDERFKVGYEMVSSHDGTDIFVSADIMDELKQDVEQE